jgi:hypothetical protein
LRPTGGLLVGREAYLPGRIPVAHQTEARERSIYFTPASLR